MSLTVEQQENPAMSPSCPLCKEVKVTLIETISTTAVINQWKQSLAMDIAAEFRAVKELRLLQCSACGLQFFEPPVVGSDGLYAALEKYDWYYDPTRWEYIRALPWIGQGASVLEVGCGRGHFLKTIMRERKALAMGLELNVSAVRQAQADGLAVEATLVEQFRRTPSQPFDVVCCFQVLEHVPNPGTFLEACAELLKPGGRLLLSVPNSDGFIGRSTDNVWNQPPHHVTRWGAQALRHLSVMFPLELAELSFEPLAAGHVDWFVNVQLDRIPAIPFVQGFLIRAGRRVLRPALHKLRLRRLIRGHTVFACYRKGARAIES